MKRVLVACGNGVATSTMVATKIREKLKEENIDAVVEQAKLLEIPFKQDNYDLIVATGRYDNSSITKPVVSGMAFLSGIGIEEIYKKIIEILR